MTELGALGEHLGPCPCCHDRKRPTLTPDSKGLRKKLDSRESFFIKLKKFVYFVDRVGYVWGKDARTGKFRKPVGFLSKLINIAPAKVRARRSTKRKKRARR